MFLLRRSTARIVATTTTITTTSAARKARKPTTTTATTKAMTLYFFVAAAAIIIAANLGNVVDCMSLDRLALERNELTTQQQQQQQDAILVDDMQLSAVPTTSGSTDMYVLLPSPVAAAVNGGDMQSNSIEHGNSATADDEPAAITGDNSDMLMLESDDTPAMQLVQLPADVETAAASNQLTEPVENTIMPASMDEAANQLAASEDEISMATNVAAAGVEDERKQAEELPADKLLESTTVTKFAENESQSIAESAVEATPDKLELLATSQTLTNEHSAEAQMEQNAEVAATAATAAAQQQQDDDAAVAIVHVDKEIELTEADSAAPPAESATAEKHVNSGDKGVDDKANAFTTEAPVVNDFIAGIEEGLIAAMDDALVATAQPLDMTQAQEDEKTDDEAMQTNADDDTAVDASEPIAATQTPLALDEQQQKQQAQQQANSAPAADVEQETTELSNESETQNADAEIPLQSDYNDSMAETDNSANSEAIENTEVLSAIELDVHNLVEQTEQQQQQEDDAAAEVTHQNEEQQQQVADEEPAIVTEANNVENVVPAATMPIVDEQQNTQVEEAEQQQLPEVVQIANDVPLAEKEEQQQVQTADQQLVEQHKDDTAAISSTNDELTTETVQAQPQAQQQQQQQVQADDMPKQEAAEAVDDTSNSMLTTIIQQVPMLQQQQEQQQAELESTATADEVFAATTTAPLNVADSVNASLMQVQEESEKQQQQLANLRRYDGAQVWRIVVQNDKDKKMADELQTKYDGQLWKEVKQEVDYLLKPQVLAAAERHVRAANLSRIVLIDNLQQVIEVENPSAEEIAKLQNRKGHRLTWQAYHRLVDIHGYIDYMAKTYPDICSVETIGYSIEKRPLKILKISNGNASNPGIWIDGGMHAREWITPATVTFIANQIIEGWEDLPDHMRNINWYLHPVANPDGYEYSHTTDRLWRKNMRSHGRQCPGVDLNRNFGYKWGGKGTSATPCSQTYRGSKAFSEPETFYISKFISSYPRDTFQAYLSFHSYGQYILYPWGYDYHLTQDRADLDRVARQAGTSITKSTGVKYTVGSSATTLYPAAGGSDDWAKGIAGIKYAYTIEMGDTGRYGFVLPAKFIHHNGKDGYTFAETVARAVSGGKESRRRAF